MKQRIHTHHRPRLLAVFAHPDDETFCADGGRVEEPATGALVRVDVSASVGQKIAAMAAHRTQYPIAPDMLPLPLLQELFGHKYFVRVHPSQALDTSIWPGALSQRTSPQRVTRTARRPKVPQPASLA